MSSSLVPVQAIPENSLLIAQFQCVQNFDMNIGSHGWLFYATIPAQCLDSMLHTRDLLINNQGRKKDTEFNKVDISNLRGSFINGGYRIEGNWRLYHRELIAKTFGKKHYTPWSIDDGSFSQEVLLSINNGNLIVNPGKNNLKRNNQGFIRDVIGDLIIYKKGNFRDKFVDQMRSEIQKLNGQNLAQMLIKQNAHQFISNKTRVSQKNAIALINNASGRIDGKINQQGLRVSLRLK
ncbi:hypothetical protein [Aulosira sp. FACHB-615]|uniref:hypothetical protein n=1 Tax=Aulosira sp. FACHB-615 TaxID=2692777 RepID=UPI0016874F89|nr:hypothetical protein [Aulosira sp. FACHB-615]MBD2492386.1 hypothetical protein [Aulosira sp. FACHB-615]